ncbi:pyridoxamine 5'-phosphate oxidase family protein [Massilia soli]|uniref:Pyridoxamine 5'-phosphate oxidase family protein n=1 Tax=Massilia soli TaxID=2792854 RepID=A0ABS7SUE5_9BURK|nr:pyridoxamine 5'-phosphate oxidase family protein [Massilia soli]MBZ2209569.1 pyridoxamine 5'-phosphate oxidase family protein [Massilia soli]
MQTKFSFHPGERAVQERAGEAAMAERNGSVIADTILGGARPFIAKQFMVVLASVDAGGAVWSSVVYGQPGFVHADSATVVTLDVPAERRADSEPFWDNIRFNPAVGMLFIELGTRRRYRINGTIERDDCAAIDIRVGEAYPNCPKFIQRRHLRAQGEFHEAGGVATGAAIGGLVATLIRAADTVFVASTNADTGADASHRGGNPGFVQVTGERTLRIPDYAGNSLFNSFGNFELDPRVGLCIPDFAGQRLLQISGAARVLWDQPDPANLTGGTGRFWEVEIASWVLRQVPQRLEWEYLDASPFNLPTAEG